MSTVTIEAQVENGQIRLPEILHLRDKTKVWVIIPNVESPPLQAASPRLRNPEEAALFVKNVTEEPATCSPEL